MLFRNLVPNYRDGACPIFNTPDTTIYRDEFSDREIRELLVICENKENGCNWSDKFGNYEV